MAYRHELHKRVEVSQAAVTGTVSNGLAQAWLTMKHGLHGAVLGKDAVPGRLVPMLRGVKVMPIQFLCHRLGIVVGLVSCGSQGRNKCYDLLSAEIYRRHQVAR